MGNPMAYIARQTIQWSKVQGQKVKRQSTKYYTENYRSSNTNLTKNRRCKQFLLHMTGL